ISPADPRAAANQVPIPGATARGRHLAGGGEGGAADLAIADCCGDTADIDARPATDRVGEGRIGGAAPATVEADRGPRVRISLPIRGGLQAEIMPGVVEGGVTGYRLETAHTGRDGPRTTSQQDRVGRAVRHHHQW